MLNVMPNTEPTRQGRLKVILGYAAGVGKTYKMLDEGQQLKAQGHDVVIGYFEPHGRKDTIAKTEGLESVPRRTIEYRDRHFEEMDTDAILARHPEICLVDELPHTNVPGAERAKRWEDVLVLLQAGIDVIATMNIQHLESLNDQMREITGIQVRETIPDWVVKRASEVVLADLTPSALMNRLDRGVVYAQDKAVRAKQNFFKPPILAALREMALRQTAHEVDIRQVDDSQTPVAKNPSIPVKREKILIHLTESAATAAIIRRGRRVADYLKAECIAVSIIPPSEMNTFRSKSRETLVHHLDFARRLHIETRMLKGDNEAETLVDFARNEGVTQIFVAKPPQGALPFTKKRTFVMDVVRLAKDIQVTAIAERRKSASRKIE